MRSHLSSLRVAALLLVALPIGSLAPAADTLPPPSLTFAPGIDPNELAGPVQWSDMDLTSTLNALELYTGRVVLRPQGLPPAQISLNARQPLTRGEAVFAIETLLALNGIGIVPVDEKFLKVIPITSVRAEAPELFVGSLRDEPASGRVVSKLFRLQHIDTATFQQQAGQFLSQFGSIVPFANSNAVIVTDTIANLQRLEYVVSEVDRRVSIETRFFQINYASAADLAQQIRTMLESARSTLQGAGVGAGPRFQVQPAQPGGQPGGPNIVNVTGVAAAEQSGSLQAVLSGNTSITADERTNQLIVITNPANLTFFENLIAQLDVPADPLTTIEVFKLNYALATELGGVISAVAGRGNTSSLDRQPNQRRQTTAAAQNNPAQQNQTQVNNATATPGLLQPRQAALQSSAQAIVEASGSQFSQLMTIEADERTNSIIISGTQNDLALSRKIIDELDVILPQVRIEVVIAEVTLGKGYQRGIDAFAPIHYERETGAITVGINADAQDGPAGPLGAVISGTLQGGVLSNYTIDAVLTAARTNSNVHLLSVPTIVTTHNQPATVLFGESRPVVTGTSTGGVNGIQQSQYSQQDIPIQLDVTPLIGPNDVVQLELRQVVNAVSDFEIIDGNRVPVVSRREAESYLIAKSGQLIVLGGLQRSFDSKTKSRMFLLGDIPLLGELFTRHEDTLNRTDLLIFLKPTVIRDADAADANARSSVRELTPSKENQPVIDKVTGETRVIEEPPADTVGPRPSYRDRR